MVTDIDKSQIIGDEVLIIKNSGEIPEIAYHNTLYHLTKDPEGPGITLDDKDLEPLRQAVISRYKWIILRDMNPEFRDKRIYRGLERSACNWQRLKAFCQREGIDTDTLNSFKTEAAKALVAFLECELKELDTGKRLKTSINCSYETLIGLAEELGLSETQIPKGIRAYLKRRD